MMYNQTRLLFLLCFIPSFLSAQTPNLSGWSIGMNGHYGKFLKHSKKQAFTIHDPIWAISADFMHQSEGRTFGSKIRNYPKSGVGVILKSYGDEAIAGKALAVYPQIDFDMIQKEKIQVYTRLGFGFCYITKPYDRVTNPTQTAIGSHFNNYTTLGIASDIQVLPPLSLHLAAHLSHVSNGSFRSPNLGMNAATLRAGLVYTLQPAQIQDTFRLERYHFSRKPLLGMKAGLSLREGGVPNGPFYAIYTLSPYMVFPRNGKHQWLTGFEMVYDTYNQDFFLNQVHDETQKERVARYSVMGGHEFLFGRIGLTTLLHIYIDPPFGKSKFFYTKIGPKLYLLQPHKHPRKNLHLSFMLEAYSAVAGYAELNLGATF